MTKPTHVSGTIDRARIVQLADHAEIMAAALIGGGKLQALRQHHLDVAAALRIFAAIEADREALTPGLRRAADICMRLRHRDDLSEDQACGVLECALAILDEISGKGGRP